MSTEEDKAILESSKCSSDELTDRQAQNLRTTYQELCNSYRAIDDFRTKLLGLLPVVSGAGVFLLLNAFTDPTKSDSAKQLFGPMGVFGFVVALGLFFYELHGIKKCDHLIKRGTRIEGSLGVKGQFTNRPLNVAGRINEPFTARIIYPAVLAAWMSLALVFTWPKAVVWAAILVFIVGFAVPHFLDLEVEEELEISGLTKKLPKHLD